MDTAQPPLTAREYLRVSRDLSGRARSVAEQHDDHAIDADRNNWVLGAAYADPGIGASKYARKVRGDWAELLAHLDAGTFDAQVLILWEASRGSRQVDEWIVLLRLCEQRGVRIWVHTHQTLYDPANPRHRRTLLEDAVDSEYEVAKLRDRVLRSKRASATAGRPAGKLLFGHARVYDERGRYVCTEPHPERAPIVREAYARFDAGQSEYALAMDFAARGIKGLRWSQTAVRRLLTNPAYAGYRVHRGEIVGRADWPALVEEQLWARCVARATNRRAKAQDTKLRHLLSGAVRCDVCGAVMRVRPHRVGYDMYQCYGQSCVAIKQIWLDEFVAELVLQRMERADALELLAPPDERESVARAQRDLAELEAHLQGFYVQAAQRKLSAAGLAAVEADILPQIEALKRRTEPTPLPAPVRALIGPGARERWADPEFTIPAKREAVLWVVDVRVRRVAHRGPRGFDPNRITWTWRQH